MEIQISQDFKKRGRAAVISIILFVIVYFILMIAAAGLTVACIVGAIGLLSVKVNFITLLVSLGLLSIGIFVSYFLIKFLFKKHVNDRSHLYKVTRSTEPLLFNMIDEIVRETGSNFPKNVYLSNEVNASVFYDSSFWSMFLPIQKNLVIGVGLVNTVTADELKAILAHEFGHFRQKSMKLGSYVYNVNQIIFNLVNDDESYRKTVQGWASIHSFLAFFAAIAIEITKGIQWILAKMYAFVNVRHMALSREMEFHADEVAANIAGSLAMEEALLRIDLANNAFHSVLSFYDGKFADSLISSNLYKEQAFVMNFIANKNNLEYKNGFPAVSLSESARFNKSKLVIENQWASHPSDSDRIERLRRLNIVKNLDNQPARNIFKNFEETQQKFSQNVFSSVKYSNPPSQLDFEVFCDLYEQNYEDGSFFTLFNSYYDNKNPDFTIDTDLSLEQNLHFNELFSDQKVELIYDQIAMEADIRIIRGIASKEYDVKTFDYDGKKFRAGEAAGLIKTLEIQAEELRTKIRDNDYLIYNYFCSLAAKMNKEEAYKAAFEGLKQFDQEYDEMHNLYASLIDKTAFVQVQTPYEKIRHYFKELLPEEERLKSVLSIYLQDEKLTSGIPEKERKNLEIYVREKLDYFIGKEYFDENLNVLMTAIRYLHFFTNRKFFKMKKGFLEFQKDLQESGDLSVAN